MASRLVYVLAATMLASTVAEGADVGSRPLALPSPAPLDLKLPSMADQPPVDAPTLDVQPLRTRPRTESPRLNVPSLPSLGLDAADPDEEGEGELSD